MDGAPFFPAAGESHRAHRHPPNWGSVANELPRFDFISTPNHQQRNNGFLDRIIPANHHLAWMNGNNVHASPSYSETPLESEFSRLNIGPAILPPAPGFVAAASSYDVGSSSSGNRPYSANGVPLSPPLQLREMEQQWMRTQSAARGQVGGLFTHPQFNSDFESFDEFRINSNTNRIWSHNAPNLYNTNGIWSHTTPNLYNNNFVETLNSNNQPESFPIRSGFGSPPFDNFEPYRALPAADGIEGISRPRPRFELTSLEDLRGKIFLVSKDQQGCRFLQEKFEKGNPDEVNMIIMEIKEHICELMVDQFGSYLVPKFLWACNQNQQLITELLLLVIKDQEIFRNICVDSHGTRSVQKLLEYLTTQEQRALVTSVLRDITFPLSKSLNGHHVIQYCLRNFPPEDTELIFNEIADNCMEIALDKCGCCLLQPSVEYATGQSRDRLIAEIAANALVLSEHSYGNYVVQHILGLKIPRATAQIRAQLSGNFVNLSMNKFGSNVVEKFLKEEQNNERVVVPIIQELIRSPNLLRVFQDPFGNYVAQSAFRASKGALRMQMRNLIEENYARLHSHPHGKRVYECIHF